MTSLIDDNERVNGYSGFEPPDFAAVADEINQFPSAVALARLQTLGVLQDNFDDPKYRPAPLLREMVEAGTLGRKTGHGFFSYRAGGDDT